MLNCLKILKINDAFVSQVKFFHLSNVVDTFSHEAKDNLKTKTRRLYNRNNHKSKYKEKFNAPNDNFLHVKNINPSSGSNLMKKFRLPQKTLAEKSMLKNVRTKVLDQLEENSGDENEDPESMLKHDEDLDLFMKNPDLYHKKQIEEDIHKRSKIKRAIIKKKLLKLEGRQEHNFNLLTWDAKEQIKYLNLNDPEEWTVEKIVESFPITSESCHKLLKSKWAPRTLDELAEHDKKAIDNWRILTKQKKIDPDKGPAINIYEMYKSQNKINMLKYATGIPGLEFERKPIIEENSYSQHEKLLCEPGKFSQLVKRDDYVKRIFLGKKAIETSYVGKLKLNEAANESASFYEKHFLMTKAELTKCLGAILQQPNDAAKKKVQINKEMTNEWLKK